MLRQAVNVLYNSKISLNVGSIPWHGSRIPARKTTFYQFAQVRCSSSDNGKDDTVSFKENKKTEARLKLEMEYYLMKEQGRYVPKQLTDEQWRKIETLPSKHQRRKYYKYLFETECRKESKQEIKEAEKVAGEERQREAQETRKSNTHITYGLSDSSLITQIRRKSIIKWQHQKVIQAIQYGPKLVFDCSFEANMTQLESKIVAKQLMHCFTVNRQHREPFDLHLCNVDWNGLTMKDLIKAIPNIGQLSYPVNCHEANMVDVFPRERLVYLTPHCNTRLKVFNPMDIYIIGGVVDKGTTTPLSLAKSKELGLRMAKLPLEKYLPFDSSKRLTLDQMSKILLDLGYIGDWRYALRHVPRPKPKRENK